MATLDEAIEKLQKVIQRSKSKRKNDHAGTLDQVTSYLIFLVQYSNNGSVTVSLTFKIEILQRVFRCCWKTVRNIQTTTTRSKQTAMDSPR